MSEHYPPAGRLVLVAAVVTAMPLCRRGTADGSRGGVHDSAGPTLSASAPGERTLVPIDAYRRTQPDAAPNVEYGEPLDMRCGRRRSPDEGTPQMIGPDP